MLCKLLFGAALVSLPAHSEAAPMRFVYSDNYIPFSWAEYGRTDGILIDIVNETIGNRMNIAVSHASYPWKRAQNFVASGEADAFVTVPTKNRREYSACSENPVITVNVNAYTYAGHPRMDELMAVKSFEDLKSFKVIDYIGNGWAKNKFKDMSITWATNLETSYRMLAGKRGDVMVRNTFNFDYYSNVLNIKDKVAKLPTALSSVAFHLCINKNSRYIDILPEFDKVIEDFNANDELNLITKNY